MKFPESRAKRRVEIEQQKKNERMNPGDPTT